MRKAKILFRCCLSNKDENMVTRNSERPSIEAVGERFVIEFKGEKYGCQAIRRSID